MAVAKLPLSHPFSFEPRIRLSIVRCTASTRNLFEFVRVISAEVNPPVIKVNPDNQCGYGVYERQPKTRQSILSHNYPSEPLCRKYTRRTFSLGLPHPRTHLAVRSPCQCNSFFDYRDHHVDCYYHQPKSWQTDGSSQLESPFRRYVNKRYLNSGAPVPAPTIRARTWPYLEGETMPEEDMPRAQTSLSGSSSPSVIICRR